MTKQEWIIKNDKPGVYVGAYREGLAKGLEIAEGFGKYCKDLEKSNGIMRIIDNRTTAELLEIYLTENEMK